MRPGKKIRTYGRVLNNILTGKRYPLSMNISVTTRCNSKCTYCNFYKKPADLPQKKIFDIIDEVSQICCHINLYGGEPLIREDIGEIVTRIQEKDGIFLTLSTNGKLVEEKLDVVRKTDLVFLSLDGPIEMNLPTAASCGVSKRIQQASFVMDRCLAA